MLGMTLKPPSKMQLPRLNRISASPLAAFQKICPPNVIVFCKRRIHHVEP